MDGLLLLEYHKNNLVICKYSKLPPSEVIALFYGPITAFLNAAFMILKMSMSFQNLSHACPTCTNTCFLIIINIF